MHPRRLLAVVAAVSVSSALSEGPIGCTANAVSRPVDSSPRTGASGIGLKAVLFVHQ
ncbi:MAG: hypothetical protein JWQ19_52 [Subtercola sp.]|nr:hypothetical protein [Subtercola sp.]